MAQGTHRTFREVTAHTAKCEKCNRHNTDVIYRCVDCTYKICTPCWNSEGATGKHRSVAITEPPTILPPLPPSKSKKKAPPVTGTARKRTTVVLSDSDDDVDGVLPDAPAKIEERKKSSMACNTDYVMVPSNGGHLKEAGLLTRPLSLPNDAVIDRQVTEEMATAANTLLEFYKAAEASSPASGVSSCSKNSDITVIRDAAHTVDKQSIPMPTLQKPAAGLMSYSAAWPKNHAQHRSLLYDLPSVPMGEALEDVDMYDYSSASSFTPINAPKKDVNARERKRTSDCVNQSKRLERLRDAANVPKDDLEMKGIDGRAGDSDSDVEIIGERMLESIDARYGNDSRYERDKQYQAKPQGHTNRQLFEERYRYDQSAGP